MAQLRKGYDMSKVLDGVVDVVNETTVKVDSPLDRARGMAAALAQENGAGYAANLARVFGEVMIDHNRDKETITTKGTSFNLPGADLSGNMGKQTDRFMAIATTAKLLTPSAESYEFLLAILSDEANRLAVVSDGKIQYSSAKKMKESAMRLSILSDLFK